MTAVLGIFIFGGLLAGFSSAQATCKNTFNDQDCEMWATRGECSNTPDFMLKQCAQSCGSCDTIPTSSPSVSLIPPRVVPLPYFLVNCEDTAKIECPSGYEITVSKANYGRQSNTACVDNAEGLDTEQGCFDDSILPLVKSACDGQEVCDYDVPASYLSKELCPGIHKYLNVTFTCSEPIFKGLRCDEESLRLQCRDSVILVRDVMYGRQDEETCQHDMEPFTTPCSSTQAYTHISQLCNYKNFCDITVTTDLLDDPCPGTNKYLDISFVCMDCKNERGDEACELWAERGECVSNSGWMMASCRKACTGCHLAASCLNALGDDQRCNEWASTGECKNNPKFMHAQCQRSCNKCQNPIQMPSPQLRPRSTTTKSPGKCTCDSIKWTGVLCKKCAPGYRGDMCEAIPTNRPRTPDEQPGQTARPVTPSRFEPSSTETSSATSTSTQTSSTSASSMSSSASTASSTPQATPTMGGPAAPATPDVMSSARPKLSTTPKGEQDGRNRVPVPAGGVRDSDVADKTYTGMYMEATVSQRWRPEYADDNSQVYEVFTEAVKKRLESFYKSSFPSLDYVLLLNLKRASSGVVATYYLEFQKPMTEVEGFKVECAISEETDQEIYVELYNAWASLATNKTTNKDCLQRASFCGANGAYSRKESGEKYCKCKDGYRGARCSSIPEWVIIVVVVVSCVCSLALIIIICICVNRRKGGDHEKGHMAESIKTAKSHMSAPMSHVSVVSSKGGPRPKMLTERHPSGHYSYY